MCVYRRRGGRQWLRRRFQWQLVYRQSGVVLSSSQASSGSAAAPGGATTIAGAEFKFTPSTDTVSKGTKITFKNAGHVPHDLKLSQGGKVVAGTKLIQAGQSASFTVNLPRTYTMFCSVPGHEQAGMKGTITVK